jgi:hypothetical protein
MLTGDVMERRISSRTIDALSRAARIYVATVRKDGSQSVAVPVWFTTMPGNVVLFQTSATSWSAKRIRRASPVMVWIGKRDGPAFVAKAELTTEPAVIRRIVEDYPRKYFLARIGFHRPAEAMFYRRQIVVARIVPIRDLPSDFASSPGSSAPSLYLSTGNSAVAASSE